MRLATWNTNAGDFGRKLSRLVEELHPDIAVITEASKPTSKLPNVRWVKDSETRGIAVYVAPEYSISSISTNGPLHRCVHGYQIFGPRSFSLLACWSHAGKRRDDYRECWVEGIEKYSKYLTYEDLVIAGDLNDNAIWDVHYPWHSPFKEIFNNYRTKYNVVSAYHVFHEEEFGREKQKSLCFLKNTRVLYHIDYVLIPQAWKSRLSSVTIGQHGDWLSMSDHMPVFVEILD